MTGERWFRVRLDSSGRAVTCEETDRAPGDDCGGVYYVRATGVVEAQSAAYQLYLAKQRAIMQERRDRYRREGKCPKCGGKRAEGKKHCARCLRRQSEDDKVHRRRLKGENVTRPPKHLAFAAARKARERDLRLELLQEVKAAYLAEGDFGAWLDAKIASAVDADRETEEVAA